MEQKNPKIQNKQRCVSCGRYFRADKRVGKRQKCCSEGCRKKHRKEQQAKWRESNPDYFKGRSDYVKAWRKKHLGYQKQWRAKKRGEIQTEIPHVSPIKSIPLKVRADVKPREIQTVILSLTYAGQALWVDGVKMQGG